MHLDGEEAKGYARGMGRRHAPLHAVLALLLLAAPALATTLYRWVDANGVTHYSDQPTEGAQKIEVAGAQTYRAPAAAATRVQKPAGPQQPGAAYTRVSITQPTPDQTFQAGTIGITADVEPGLKPGHLLWFVIDGAREAEPAQGPSTSVELGRGSHTASALVTDAGGVVVIASEAVTFYVHQSSILKPPQGPLLKK